MKQKRGQVFILAAIVVSVVVMSMGITANYAHVQNEPRGFEDLGLEVKREAGAVMDYEIYSGFDEGINLEEFISLVVADLRDRDFGANFMFIYGDETEMIIENYGSDVAQVSSGIGQPLQVAPGGLNIQGSVSYGGSSQGVYEDYVSLGGTGARATLTSFELVSAESIEVKILGNDFSFPISKHKQVIFLMQKEEGDEAYITVK